VRLHQKERAPRADIFAKFGESTLFSFGAERGYIHVFFSVTDLSHLDTSKNSVITCHLHRNGTPSHPKLQKKAKLLAKPIRLPLAETDSAELHKHKVYLSTAC